MSYRLHGFADFSRTGCVVDPLLPSYQAIASSSFARYSLVSVRSPAHVAVLVPARHACSHSASVGNPTFRPRTSPFSRIKNSIESSQLTRSTGRSALLKRLGFAPITASHNACVTGVSPSQ